MHPEEIFKGKDSASNLNSFNNAVRNILEPIVWTTAPQNRYKLNYAIVPFAFFARMLHALYYYPVKNFVDKKTKRTVFYHSVLFGVLLFTYPLYLAAISFILIALGLDFYLALSVFVIFPLLAYTTTLLKT